MLIKLTIHFIIDNIDTRSALDAVRDLVTYCNIYMKERKQPNTLLLRDVAVYITKMFIIFGVISSHDSIGFPVDSNTANLNVCFIYIYFLFTYVLTPYYKFY